MKTESVIIQHEMADDRSQRLRYCDLVLGTRDFWKLIKYELIVTFCAAVPGALGLFLRSWLYPCLLGKCGRGVVFGANVVLRHPHKIRVGDGVMVDDNCLLDAKGRDNMGITIGDGVFVGRNSILSCKNGDIVLGANVNIGFNSEVFSGSKVQLGNDTFLAAYCYLIGGDHEFDAVEQSALEQGSRSCGIEIGEKCWLGAGVKVLDGVKIGQKCVVGAGAVVTTDIPEYSVAVGIPARVVRDRRSEAGG